MRPPWHHIPGQDAAEAIASANNGRFPPTFWEAVDIARRLGYATDLVPEGVPAQCNHTRRLVLIPAATEERQAVMMLHELTEIVLRLPVAPEFHYDVNSQDECHAVARWVENAAADPYADSPSRQVEAWLKKITAESETHMEALIKRLEAEGEEE